MRGSVLSGSQGALCHLPDHLGRFRTVLGHLMFPHSCSRHRPHLLCHPPLTPTHPETAPLLLAPGVSESAHFSLTLCSSQRKTPAMLTRQSTQGGWADIGRVEEGDPGMAEAAGILL